MYMTRQRFCRQIITMITVVFVAIRNIFIMPTHMEKVHNGALSNIVVKRIVQ